MPITEEALRVDPVALKKNVCTESSIEIGARSVSEALTLSV